MSANDPVARDTERIAIFGGGIGALTTAYFLTDPSLAGRYKVTVYTMGWRLGGKGASGRNRGQYSRIEEHGLHLWFGSYRNAIAMMQDIYTELGRPRNKPLSTFDEAFKGHDRFVLKEKIGGQWREWDLDMPKHPNAIHDSTPDKLLQILLCWVESRAGALFEFRDPDFGAAEVARGSVPPAEHTVAAMLAKWDGELQRWQSGSPVDWLQWSEALRLLARAIWWLIGHKVPEDDDARHFWIPTYLGITAARGMINDQIYRSGFESIDRYDLRVWLRKHSSFSDFAHSVPDEVALFSAPLQAFYDCSFSYADGNVATPNIAAGVALRAVLSMAFDYAGSFALEMQAGMGEAVFVPLYQVLKKRGVEFEFFHRLTALTLAADKHNIESALVSRQVILDHPYEPLVTVKDLECWPTVPRFEQLVDGATLKASGANIEHWNSGWSDSGGSYTLESGKHFSRLVLAISYKVLPYVTSSLDFNPKWKSMVAGLQATWTQAAQLWFVPTRSDLGMQGPAAVLGSYVAPWSSLADFSHLIAREGFTTPCPKYLCYTCATLAVDGPHNDDDVYANLKRFLEHDTTPLWPNALVNGTFDWDVLWADGGSQGEARLKRQYWRANTDPTESYVISAATTVACRLSADQSGFANLVLAGEWTDTLANISSIEGTVISGMRAARAISGFPQRIIGESNV